MLPEGDGDGFGSVAGVDLREDCGDEFFDACLAEVRRGGDASAFARYADGAPVHLDLDSAAPPVVRHQFADGRIYGWRFGKAFPMRGFAPDSAGEKGLVEVCVGESYRLDEVAAAWRVLVGDFDGDETALLVFYEEGWPLPDGDDEATHNATFLFRADAWTLSKGLRKRGVVEYAFGRTMQNRDVVCSPYEDGMVHVGPHEWDAVGAYAADGDGRANESEDKVVGGTGRRVDIYDACLVDNREADEARVDFVVADVRNRACYFQKPVGGFVGEGLCDGHMVWLGRFAGGDDFERLALRHDATVFPLADRAGCTDDVGLQGVILLMLGFSAIKL